MNLRSRSRFFAAKISQALSLGRVSGNLPALINDSQIER